ncbi:uncharacterized protein TM35_000251010 [Trypanosoma theileri]|uniref:Uncharacterized protein n=1 Tax=Trypanosoma theileri TaxID=67003 RepID=A0A1X0NQ17_9TRYP|nr:uncharacterized protein TM35_000251010 [Trypanosoma theileri]ORC86805.1 hypothetical protein TM35_000251010 [Trypanosoma theileri]
MCVQRREYDFRLGLVASVNKNCSPYCGPFFFNCFFAVFPLCSAPWNSFFFSFFSGKLTVCYNLWSPGVNSQCHFFCPHKMLDIWTSPFAKCGYNRGVSDHIEGRTG